MNIEGIPDCPIPAGMKRGTPEYTHRHINKGDWFFRDYDQTWQMAEHDSSFLSKGIIANFVPIEPEEPEFIDNKRLDGNNDYRVSDISGIEMSLLYAANHVPFVEYLWKDAVGHIYYRSPYMFRHFKHGICTHVRFKNPKYKSKD